MTLHIDLIRSLQLRPHSLFVILAVCLTSGCDQKSTAPPQSARGAENAKFRRASAADRNSGDASRAQSRLGQKAPNAPSDKRSISTEPKGRRQIAAANVSQEALQRLHAMHRRRDADALPSTGSDEPLDVLLKRYASSSDPAAQLEIIHALTGRDDAQSLALLSQEALEADSPELRAAAIEALAESPREEHLSVAASALASDDSDVQSAGIWLLGHLRTEEAIPIWQRVITGPSQDLALLAFDRIAEAPEPIQLGVTREALASKEPWIVEQSLMILGGINAKPAVEALIPSIDHSQSGDLAQDGLMFLLGRFFETSADARQWWQANQASLGSDLQPLEIAPIGSDPAR